MILDVIKREEIVIFDDTGLGLLGVDVLEGLESATIAEGFVF